jgi:NitT/TauT family transport system permease protein/sulfonate transport system permease protein
VGRDRWVSEGVLGLLLLAWFIGARRLPEFVLPSPPKVLALTARLFFDPSLAQHTAASLLRVIASVCLALLLASGLVLLGRALPVTRRLVEHRVTPFFNSFPSLGWAILAVIWFGVSNTTVLVVETAILLPFCLINMAEGVKALDAELVEMGRSFTRHRLRILWRVTLPLLFPYIFAALRISYGVGWKVSLIAELFGSNTGLGYLLNLARQNFDTPLLFATIVAIILLVGAVERLGFDRLEARVMRQRAVLAAA